MENKENNTPSTGIGMLIRIYWMVFGNFINILIAINIVVKKHNSIMLLSIFYFMNIIGLIISRYIDIKYLNGQTTEYEPATMNHWKNYLIKTTGIYLGLWIIVYFMKDYAFLKI
ncbi:MAG: hypothetical protein PHX78_02855 [bacterium]|nr:hypothetical protein [bacterium]